MMYALLIDEKIVYVSKDKSLLQELMMDEYFDSTYNDWLNYNFRIPYFYNILNMKKEDEYITPNRWWNTMACTIQTNCYEIINLEDYYIE